MTLRDGLKIETLLLRPSASRWTACLSSQVGCAFGCSFCATGLMGFSRDLRPEEITDQLLFWRRWLALKGIMGPQNVVYMGMGEPLAAYESVAESLRRLMDPRDFAMGPSRICVSTVGIAPEFDRFCAQFPKVRIALSLHAAEDSLRARLVPSGRAYPLERLAESLGKQVGSGRKIFLEYVLLRGENDRPRDAESLIRYLRGIGAPELLHVNLIPYNPTASAHRPTSEPHARAFQDALRRGGLRATLRRTLGQDIAGACGQLLA